MLGAHKDDINTWLSIPVEGVTHDLCDAGNTLLTLTFITGLFGSSQRQHVGADIG